MRSHSGSPDQPGTENSISDSILEWKIFISFIYNYI